MLRSRRTQNSCFPLNSCFPPLQKATAWGNHPRQGQLPLPALPRILPSPWQRTWSPRDANTAGSARPPLPHAGDTGWSLSGHPRLQEPAAPCGMGTSCPPATPESRPAPLRGPGASRRSRGAIPRKKKSRGKRGKNLKSRRRDCSSLNPPGSLGTGRTRSRCSQRWEARAASQTPCPESPGSRDGPGPREV